LVWHPTPPPITPSDKRALSLACATTSEVDSWEEITTADLYRSPQGCPRLARLSLATCWNISAHLIRGTLTTTHP
jgi:hypothetical protein